MNTTTHTPTRSPKTEQPKQIPSSDKQQQDSAFVTPTRRFRTPRKRSISRLLSASGRKKYGTPESKCDLKSDSKPEDLPKRERKESFAERHARTMSRIFKAQVKSGCVTPKPSAHTPVCALIANAGDDTKRAEANISKTGAKVTENKWKDNEKKLQEEISALKLEIQRLKKEATLDNALISKEYAKLRQDQESHAKQVACLKLQQQEMSQNLHDFCRFQKKEHDNIKLRERMVEEKRKELQKMKAKMDRLQKKHRIEKQDLEKERRRLECDKETFEEEKMTIRANMELLSKLRNSTDEDPYVSTLAKRRLKDLKHQPEKRNMDRMQTQRQQTQLNVELENLKNQQRQILSEHQVNEKVRLQLAAAKIKLENHVKMVLVEQTKASARVKEELEMLQKDRKTLGLKVAQVELEREELRKYRACLLAEVEREKVELDKGFERLRKEQEALKDRIVSESTSTDTELTKSWTEMGKLVQDSSVLKRTADSDLATDKDTTVLVKCDEPYAVEGHGYIGEIQQMQDFSTPDNFPHKPPHPESQGSKINSEDLDELVQHIRRLRTSNG